VADGGDRASMMRRVGAAGRGRWAMGCKGGSGRGAAQAENGVMHDRHGGIFWRPYQFLSQEGAPGYPVRNLLISWGTVGRTRVLALMESYAHDPGVDGTWKGSTVVVALMNTFAVVVWGTGQGEELVEIKFEVFSSSCQQNRAEKRGAQGLFGDLRKKMVSLRICFRFSISVLAQSSRRQIRATNLSWANGSGALLCFGDGSVKPVVDLPVPFQFEKFSQGWKHYDNDVAGNNFGPPTHADCALKNRPPLE